MSGGSDEEYIVGDEEDVKKRQHMTGNEENKSTSISSANRGPPVPGLTAGFRIRHYVQHTYHDYAGLMEIDVQRYLTEHQDGDGDHDEPEQVDPTLGGTSKKRKTKRSGINANSQFPMKLHRLMEESNDESIVSWQPHGRALIIKDTKRFTDELMPKYFKQSKLTSFQRQLNLYGFQRLTRGPDSKAYYHELFLRGKPYLCNLMVRVRVKGTGYKAASNPEMEPKLYELPPLPPSGRVDLSKYERNYMMDFYSKGTNISGAALASDKRESSTSLQKTAPIVRKASIHDLACASSLTSLIHYRPDDTQKKQSRSTSNNQYGMELKRPSTDEVSAINSGHPQHQQVSLNNLPQMAADRGKRCKKQPNNSEVSPPLAMEQHQFAISSKRTGSCSDLNLLAAARKHHLNNHGKCNSVGKSN